MTALDTKFRAKAKDMIDRYGAAMLLTRISLRDMDSNTLTVESVTTTIECKGVVLEGRDSGGDGDIARTSAREIIVAAAAFAFDPSMGDMVQIVRTKKIYRVIEAEPVHSGEEVAIWQLKAQA